LSLKPSEICKVFGVETRVQIIELLKNKGPLGANEIADLLNITPPAVSQHLKILKHADIVRSERNGYWIPYSLNLDVLAHYQQKITKICSCECHRHHNTENLHHLDNLDINELENYKKQLESKIKYIENILDK